jgi:hypothetical protein
MDDGDNFEEKKITDMPHEIIAKIIQQSASVRPMQCCKAIRDACPNMAVSLAIIEHGHRKAMLRACSPKGNIKAVEAMISVCRTASIALQDEDFIMAITVASSHDDDGGYDQVSLLLCQLADVKSISSVNYTRTNLDPVLAAIRSGSSRTLARLYEFSFPLRKSHVIAAVNNRHVDALKLLLNSPENCEAGLIHALTMYEFETAELIVDIFAKYDGELWFERNQTRIGNVLADCMFFDALYDVATEMLMYRWRHGFDLRAGALAVLEHRDVQCARMVRLLFDTSNK